MNINQELKKYIEEKIMIQYDKNNYGGHGWSHIISVIDRSFDLANKFNLDINPDIAYVVASYHDIGYRKDPDNHEQVSSEIFLQDEMMKHFFTDEERKIIAEAIIDHRASLEYEARNIYGRLVSSADREISVENMLERSIKFQSEKHKEERPTINQVIEYSFKKLSSKYGKGGYAKMYFPDEKYEEYLKTMQELFSDKDKFIQAEREIIFSRFDILKKYFISDELQKYIQNIIFPKYNINDNGHGIDHIKYVIDRSLKFASYQDDINYNMVYVIAAYHDIGHYMDAKNHEKVSADMLLEDINLRKFFTEEEIKIMSEAIYDHRASLEGEPRSIYGKIVSSADRNTLVEVPLKRTYAYRVEHNPNDTLEEIIEGSRQHIINKFGKKGYATEKMYFEDLDYKKFLEEISVLAEDKEAFRRRFMEVNGLNDKLKLTFDEIKRRNSNMSLDEVLYAVYDTLKDDYNKPFDVFRNMILEANGIDELEYYTKNVRQDLKDYIVEHIFPEYEKNDGGHNIAHILEVIRRSFALNDTFKLGLDDNMIYAIASCHDWGKYEDHSVHHLIAARNFMNDEGMNKFFTPEEKQIIKEAIEDHRSSKEDEPRSVYGKLISSADRNTRIEIVFIRSFFVAHERTPDANIEEYLDYTIERLSKKYDEENPENMFYEDETYKVFIQDMRDLLKNAEEFKNRYCEVNHITSREHRVKDERGEVAYTKVLKK